MDKKLELVTSTIEQALEFAGISSVELDDAINTIESCSKRNELLEEIVNVLLDNTTIDFYYLNKCSTVSEYNKRMVNRITEKEFNICKLFIKTNKEED